MLRQEQASREEIMKAFIAILSGLLLCSCADMYVTKTDVAGSTSRRTVSSDAKDSKGIYMTTNCGVGASQPKAIAGEPNPATSKRIAKPVDQGSLF